MTRLLFILISISLYVNWATAFFYKGNIFGEYPKPEPRWTYDSYNYNRNFYFREMLSRIFPDLNGNFYLPPKQLPYDLRFQEPGKQPYNFLIPNRYYGHRPPPPPLSMFHVEDVIEPISVSPQAANPFIPIIQSTSTDSTTTTTTSTTPKAISTSTASTTPFTTTSSSTTASTTTTEEIKTEPTSISTTPMPKSGAVKSPLPIYNKWMPIPPPPPPSCLGNKPGCHKRKDLINPSLPHHIPNNPLVYHIQSFSHQSGHRGQPFFPRPQPNIPFAVYYIVPINEENKPVNDPVATTDSGSSGENEGTTTSPEEIQITTLEPELLKNTPENEDKTENKNVNEEEIKLEDERERENEMIMVVKVNKEQVPFSSELVDSVKKDFNSKEKSREEEEEVFDDEVENLDFQRPLYMEELIAEPSRTEKSIVVSYSS